MSSVYFTSSERCSTTDREVNVTDKRTNCSRQVLHLSVLFCHKPQPVVLHLVHLNFMQALFSFLLAGVLIKLWCFTTSGAGRPPAHGHSVSVLVCSLPELVKIIYMLYVRRHFYQHLYQHVLPVHLL